MNGNKGFMMFPLLILTAVAFGIVSLVLFNSARLQNRALINQLNSQEHFFAGEVGSWAEVYNNSTYDNLALKASVTSVFNFVNFRRADQNGFTGRSGNSDVVRICGSLELNPGDVSPKNICLVNRLVESKASGLDGFVNALLLTDDGSSRLYVGGNFETYRNHMANRILRLNPDGTRDATFYSGDGFDSGVTSLATADDGTHKIYVGGSFQHYNGAPSMYLARLNPDGTLDSTFTTGTFDLSLGVSQIVVMNDGSHRIYVAGGFLSYNGITVNRIMRLLSDGSLDTTFNPGGSAANGIINDCVIMNDGTHRLYVGGAFTSYNGVTQNYIVRLNPDGSIDNSFAIGSGFDAPVTKMAATGDGTDDIYVGGTITKYNNVSTGELIRLTSSGAANPSFGIGPITREITALYVTNDGTHRVYVGTRTSGGLLRLFPDGTVDATFNTGTGLTSIVFTSDPVAFAFLDSPDGNLYIGGDFYSYQYQRTGTLMKVSRSAVLDTAYTQGGVGIDGYYTHFSPSKDGTGRIYAGGWFRSFDGTDIFGELIRINPDGSRDSSFIPPYVSRATIAMAEAIDGSFKIYASHYDTRNPLPAVTRYNPDGSVDNSFTPGKIVNGYYGGVDHVVPSLDVVGQLYLSGNFLDYNGTTQNGIARLNADGSVDTTFFVGTRYVASVFSLVPVGDGSNSIFVSGTFTGSIAKLKANGTEDINFNVGAGFDNAVYAILPTGGKVYAVGFFDHYQGYPAHRIARLNGDGSLDATFNSGTGFDIIPKALALNPDGSGRIYVAGAFTSYNGNTANQLVRINSDGSIDNTFSSGSGFHYNPFNCFQINVVADGTGRILVSGELYSYRHRNIAGIVEIYPDGTIANGAE